MFRQGRRSRRALACCLAALLGLLPGLSLSGAASGEYALKAAFLYKFLLFTDFTYESTDPSPEQLSICIWGDDPFGDAFVPVTGVEIDNRRLTIRRLGESRDVAQLMACRLLFFSGENPAKQVKTVLQMMGSRSVLTVGEHPDFLRWGGIIRIYKKQARVVFTVNNDAGREAGIRFRSQMLRIAIRVIDKGAER